MPAPLRDEALCYWRNAKRFRLASRLATDTSEWADELAVMVQYTQNAVIRRDANRALGANSAVAAK